MESTITFLRKAWYQSKIVLHRTCNAVWKWCKYEFTGDKGKRKWQTTCTILIAIGVILWATIKVIGYALMIVIVIFKLLLSMGDKD
jgi:O-antigen ligase